MASEEPQRFMRLADADPYTPAGHDGIHNRLLIARALQGSERVSVWHGVLESGGRAEPHVHADADQVYVAISGTTLVGVDDREYELAALSAVFIAAGSDHWVRNTGPEQAELLVISSPALR